MAARAAVDMDPVAKPAAVSAPTATSAANNNNNNDNTNTIGKNNAATAVKQPAGPKDSNHMGHSDINPKNNSKNSINTNSNSINTNNNSNTGEGEDTRAATLRSAAAASDALLGGSGSFSHPSLLATMVEYKGVLLMPGEQEIPFEEGTYYGTVDTNGRMAGHGRAVWQGGDEYRGEWLHDRMHGKGEYIWADGDYYRGEYENGFMSGFGEMKDSVGHYVGEWFDDMRQGEGKMIYAGGNIYEGEWLTGMRHGSGKLIETSGVTYEGQFVRNEKEGKGVQTNSNGDYYEGDFARGKPNGRGTYIWADGAKYIGNFKDGLKHGEGCEWLANGDWMAGNFVMGEHDHMQAVHKAIKADEEDLESGLLDLLVQHALEPLDDKKMRRLSVLETANAADVSSSLASSTASPFTSALAPQSTKLIDVKALMQWRSVRVLGKGSFGAAHEARLPDGRRVCCKVIELGSIENHEELEKLKNEIDLMKRMSHPNIVQYYGSFEDKAKNTMNIFMELVSGGTVNTILKKAGTGALPARTIRQWAYQMICGVKYLHERGIVHRDIKGDNVLVTPEGIVKLADFGCSKSIDDVCSATHGCSTMVGTPYWMAPEVIKCEAGGYGMKSDVWSIGCTIVEMITGKPPWPECNSMWAAVYKIANSSGLPTEIPKDLDPLLMQVLERCFERDPRKRPSAAELLTMPFLTPAATELPVPEGSNDDDGDGDDEGKK